ncbi:uncharacterized protein A4U43_C08F23330 [Asparagus officinalis]|nr:uncharacterized protein A4U43_C08F23330 [Asparagus officinalis]
MGEKNLGQIIHKIETNKEQLADVVDEDLQRRVLKAEAALKIKEEENLTLKQELQLYETKWSDYKAKIKSMEELWQKQVTSLQMSLAAAKKSLAIDDSESQQGKSSSSAKGSKVKDAAIAQALSYADIPNSQIRKVTSSRLLLSKQTLPHYYLTVDTWVDKHMQFWAHIVMANEFLFCCCG